jgi:hypothetical protein
MNRMGINGQQGKLRQQPVREALLYLSVWVLGFYTLNSNPKAVDCS